MSAPPSSSYDALPYESHPYERTQPDHLATLARLFGMQPPDVDSCRVLELGCAAGGNLIPQALACPDARFVGVDLSRRQLEEGWQLVAELGLTNIDLRHADIRELQLGPAEFDYIICHGVYSWVPRAAQDRILSIVGEHLAPQGVAYISYNTYPGWFLRGMVRRMMCYHARQFDEPAKQVEQARALLDFLIKAGPGSDPTYHALLVRELEIIRNRADSYLYHEHLEEENEPLFFYEFMERAEAAGLRYLSEAQFSEMVPGNFSSDAERTLRELNVGLIHAEQYLDFLRNRTFRRTLLCRQNVELQRQLGPDQLRGMFVGCALRPAVESPSLVAPGELRFVSGNGHAVTVSQPLIKSALVQLERRWPDLVAFESLPGLAHDGLGTPLVRDAAHYATDLADLGSMIMELYAADLIELRLRPPRFATELSARPVASPLARMQLEHHRLVTNLRHEIVQLSDLQTHLLKRLDGEHDEARLCEALLDLVREGQLVMERHGRRLVDEEAREFLRELVARDLQNLSRKALLIA